MQPITDNTAARRVLRNYLVYAEGKLPDDTFTRLEALVDSPSGVDAVCKVAELLYARRDQLDEEGRTVVAQLAAFAATNFWHGMGEGNRGGLIAQAMMRDNGVKPASGTTQIKAADDPEPQAIYAAEPEAAAPPAASGTGA